MDREFFFFARCDSPYTAHFLSAYRGNPLKLSWRCGLHFLYNALLRQGRSVEKFLAFGRNREFLGTADPTRDNFDHLSARCSLLYLVRFSKTPSFFLWAAFLPSRQDTEKKLHRGPLSVFRQIFFFPLFTKMVYFSLYHVLTRRRRGRYCGRAAEAWFVILCRRLRVASAGPREGETGGSSKWRYGGEERERERERGSEGRREKRKEKGAEGRRPRYGTLSKAWMWCTPSFFPSLRSFSSLGEEEGPLPPSPRRERINRGQWRRRGQNQEDRAFQLAKNSNPLSLLKSRKSRKTKL